MPLLEGPSMSSERKALGDGVTDPLAFECVRSNDDDGDLGFGDRAADEWLQGSRRLLSLYVD
jgi:hypothetical protein